jgi:hypothetical protein
LKDELATSRPIWEPARPPTESELEVGKTTPSNTYPIAQMSLYTKVAFMNG